MCVLYEVIEIWGGTAPGRCTNVEASVAPEIYRAIGAIQERDEIKRDFDRGPAIILAIFFSISLVRRASASSWARAAWICR